VFSGRIETRPGLWESLNFVTARRLASAAGRAGLSMTLLPSAGDTLRRLRSEPAFGRRHPWAARVARSPLFGPLTGAVDRWPPRWMTPMLVVLRHA
jgi:hypothetical protein